MTQPDDPYRAAPERAEPPIAAEPAAPNSQRVMLPLFQPRAAWVLLVLNVAIFVITNVLGLYELSIFLGAKDNAAILSGEWYRFLTSMFLHGSITHIGFNAFAIYSLGLDTERFFGTLRFVVIYFLAGSGGGIASYAFSANNAVGASGAIFGLIGALTAFFYLSRNMFGEMSRQQVGSLIFITLINLGFGLSTPGIDNFAHIGGLVTGLAVGYLLTPRMSVGWSGGQPSILRQDRSYAWTGSAAVLALLLAAAWLITPP
ncbi:MAG: rhomboid family intramembrane serine protease [Roseiflexaceae bacterium]